MEQSARGKKKFGSDLYASTLIPPPPAPAFIGTKPQGGYMAGGPGFTHGAPQAQT